MTTPDPARSADLEFPAWLLPGRRGPRSNLKVLIAAGEALANAIEHKHRQRREGTISLRVTLIPEYD